MAYNTTTQASGSERLVLSLFAAGAMFVTGYTAVRVAMAQPSSSNPAVQTNVVPHQSALWVDSF